MKHRTLSLALCNDLDGWDGDKGRLGWEGGEGGQKMHPTCLTAAVFVGGAMNSHCGP